MFCCGYSVLLWIGLGYVLGSIPFGVLISMGLKGIDPRKVASRNSGATNVYRTVGWSGAILVALSDVLKSMVPVYYILKVLERPNLAMVVALSCVLGHIWSCFLRFKGGKGIATGAGSLFPFVPYLVIVSIIFWLLITRWTRYAFLASSVCAAVVLVGGVIFSPYPFFGYLALSMGGVILFSHKQNFIRFIQGKEHKI
ncbi:glycerol-3-phosphate acyltransferase [Holospora obtusa F1]|uniref:Glycerol-3-phosphate acyltransferase n=1 Tax=Holospora obtusa F1 TaxID=1399147 RepID=W6TD74_HOLOB|nr:glycerol-3-phosphate 1-O-acyltransferase PlsY [Holospora obtusa]ETZ06888.1 glycerol-3-phosphate acyltransferase [Holospora obtusa F1]